jgi:hypothetical protein
MAIKHFPMVHARSAIALDPRLFGRGRMRTFDQDSRSESRVSDDVRLFVTTFAVGFLFVSIFIA